MADITGYLEEHLPYELAMLQHTFQRIRESTGDDRNAFMESFCIHARNLKTFVTNNRGRGGNGVVAKDFVDWPGKLKHELKGAFQRIQTQIAHLGGRGGEKFTVADAEAVFTWLNDAMVRLFVGALSQQDRVRWGSKPLEVPAATSKASATGLFSEAKLTIVPLAADTKKGRPE
jgi:hypothetical protein